jgi:hypothetical protein
VRPDGKLDLSLRERPGKQIDSDAQLIIAKLKGNDGFLPLNDDSSPEEVRDRLGMSKGSFKRAVGRLLKLGVIQLTETGMVASKGNDH